jgi:hypothetical protein
MSAPPEFADHYWHYMQPQLANLCVALGRCVAADVEDYGGALATIMRHARKAGALYLPDDRYHALYDWILLTLSQEIERAEATGWTTWLEDNHIQGGRVP